MENKPFKLLAIDDTADNLISLKALVAEAFPEAEFLTAQNGADGIDLARTERPDVIVLDIIMPHMDGYQVCTLLKQSELTKHIPILLLTAIKTDSESRGKGLDLGADAFLSKPIDYTELKSQIKVLLRIKWAEDALRAENSSLEELVAQRTEQLLASEQKYKALFDFSPLPYHSLNSDGIFIDVNKAWLDTLGYTRDEVIGCWYGDFLHPDWKVHFEERFPKFKSCGAVNNVDFRLRHKDGHYVDISLDGTAAYNEDGSFRQTYCVFQDITIRKKVEQQLLESELVFQQFMENSPIYVFFKDENLRSVRLSKNYETMLGKPLNELLGKSMNELFPSQLTAQMVADDRAILMKGKTVTANEELNGKYYTTIKFPIYIDGIPRFLAGYTIDITQQRQSELLISENERKLSTLIGNLPGMVYRCANDEHWTMKYVSDGFFELTGYAPHEVINNEFVSFNQIIHPKDRDYLAEEWRRVLGSEETFDNEYRIITKSGDEKWVREQGSAVLDEAGKVIALEGFIYDITEKKLADNLIFKERTMLRTLIDNIPDIVYVKDVNARKVIANVADIQNIGFVYESDVIGKNDLELFPGPIGERGYEDDLWVIKTGEPIINHEEYFIGDNGELRWYVTSKLPLFSMDGVVTGLVGLAHEITQQKKTLEQLQQSNEFTTNLLKSIPFSMHIVDEFGTVLFQNGLLKDQFGVDGIGKKCWEIYRDDKQQCTTCPLLNGISQGKNHVYEAEGVNGGRVFEISHIGMTYNGKPAMLEIFQDITQRRKDELELINAKEKAEESERLKSSFLHNISHEIRTPMNSIVGFSRLLNHPNLDLEKRKDFTNIIIQSTEQLLTIITDIVNISTIDAGQVKLVEKELNLNTLLKDLKFQFTEQANIAKLDFTLKTVLPDADVIILCDEAKLSQIISNLIRNAFKFTQKGSVTFGYVFLEGYFQFYVRDTGVGIPKNMYDGIFERFRQVEGELSRQFGGSGLGLSITKAYVELLGGRIWLESQEGVGTSFYFTLPCKRINNKPLVDSLVNVFSQDDKATRTILVAEDEDINYFLLSEFFEGVDINLVRAINGKEAVEIAKSDSVIDLVLMDIKMPVMDGYEATKQIRLSNETLPIIVQTAFSNDEDIDKAYASGCNDFISKPINKEALFSKIYKFLY